MVRIQPRICAIRLEFKRKTQSIFDDKAYSEMPVYTKYKGLTENAILKIIKDVDRIQRNDEGEIVRVFFYYDKTNPQSNSKYWTDYFEIIKAFSKFEISNK